MKNEVEIKIITLGASGVGKTSLIKRIKFGTFAEKNEATLGVDYFVVKKKYQNKNIMILLKYQDTNGLESMQGIIPQQYIRDSQIVLLVFSNINTLNEVINRWYSFYKENANIDQSKFILIGNKKDFFGDEKEEIERQGSQFAEEIDAHFITCSAKSADNMDNLERYILTEAKKFIDENEKKIVDKLKLNNINRIDTKKKLNNEKKNCC